MEALAGNAWMRTASIVAALAAAILVTLARPASAGLLGCTQVVVLTTGCDPTPSPSSEPTSPATNGPATQPSTQPSLQQQTPQQTTRTLTKTIKVPGPTRIERIFVPAPAPSSVAGPSSPRSSTNSNTARWPGALAMLGGALGAAGAIWLIRRRSKRNEPNVDQLRREILSNVSHELRTPLVPMRGYADLIRRKQLPRAQTKQFAEQIVEASSRLERVIDGVTTLAEISSGSQAIVPVAVDLGALTQRAALSAHPTRVHVQLPSEPFTIGGDPRLLKIAIEQLLDNSLKFSDDDVEVDVRVSGRHATVSVSDQGAGIEESDMATIFEDLRQADGSATRRYGGMGVGLSLARRIAELHHGTITVRSRPGEGSTFTLTIPAAKPAGERKRVIALPA